MKRLRLFSLLAILVLAATPFTVFAQGDAGKTKDFTSKDGKLTVSYPETWFAQENDATSSLYGVTLGNSQAVLDKAFTSENSDLATGEQAMVIFLLPTSFLSMAGMTIDPNAGVADLTQSLVDLLFAKEQTAEGTATPEFPNVSAAEEVDLTKDLKAGYSTVKDATLEGAVIAYPLSPDVLAITFVFAFPGEYTEELATLGKQVAATIKFDGTGDDLMAILSGGGASGTETATPEATSGTPSAALDGKALVEERCTICHGIERVNEQIQEGTSLAEWTRLVDSMIANGAQLNAEERQAVLDYLSTAK